MKIKSIRRIVGDKKYHIQVEKNHNFFANGILVHNCNMYPDKYHARSIDSRDHPSRNYAKGIWGNIKHEIPNGWRICGENLYAKHSIFYDKLPSYFMVFSIWDENNSCLSWKDTVEISTGLGLTTVRPIGIIEYDEEYLKELSKNFDVEKKEGYVIRNVDAFHYDNFTENVAKWVRKGHVNENSTHWMYEKIISNKLLSNDCLL